MFASSLFKNSFQEFKKSLIKNDKNFDERLFIKAIKVTESAHEKQFRESGDPYITHPFEVCKSLIEIKLDTESVISGLLHDVIEDSDIEKKEIKEIFGESISDLVDGLTKIDFLEEKKVTKSEKEAENFRKLLISTAKDIRVLIIKLADRLHNIKTIHYVKNIDKRKRVSNETLLIYAPLAQRLGLENWKTILENISFKNLHPDIYNRINDKINNTFSDLESSFFDLQELLNQRIFKNNIKAKIQYRKKSPYSIWKKLNKKQIEFNSISDIAAVRIIVNNTRDCYKILGIVHRNFSAKVGRFKDYISSPKPNGYRSIHTDIFYNNKVFEIQIRSRAMNMIAENGIAAHWKYKYINQPNQKDENLYQWLRDTVNYVEENNTQNYLLNKTSNQFFDEQIYVFSPKGDLYTLPVGSTPVDFAYTVHTDIGDRCSGAKVNGIEVQLKTNLNSGDQVEIILDKNKAISPLWIRYVKKQKVRDKIRHFFKSQRKKEFETLGQDILLNVASLKKVNIDQSVKINLLKNSDHKNLNKLYESIGRGFLSKRKINELFSDSEKSLKKYTNSFTSFKVNPKSININKYELGIAVNLATCCSPISGDDIISIISHGRGLVVHNTMCDSLSYYHKDNFYKSSWGIGNKDLKFSSRIEIIIK
ncbi:MAG: bifunctional (p)ppGpp synthetase/guanosine-3',5'-bis(diphosphate) 3'-pyrophosphohydrolase, partial [Pelagibacteraceae bacterium]|nr:bifunctional (p)ppGpp synthetase/guanosine-3',5'-bis(diphosphate) 3'-pyrophosphohydrolase [Pelagibacteraceae bacterium]